MVDAIADALSPDEVRAHGVLFVDDNVEAVELFASRFSETFTLFTATSPTQALNVLAREDISVLLTDYRMPGMSGIDLCEHVKVRWPRVLRAVITGYADSAMALDAINRGEIHRMLTRPAKDHEKRQLLNDLVARSHLRRTVETLERQMMERERDAYVALARGGILHDLANVSNGLSLSCYVLGEHFDAVSGLLPMHADHEIREQLESITLFINHITELHAQARELSGASKNKREPLDVRELVECTVEMVRREPGADVAFEVVCPTTHLVHVDRVDISRVLLNLMRNARQALEEVAEPTIRVEVSQVGLDVEIRISDNGPGTPAHLRERVFELSWSTRAGEGGQGYGLYLSRALARANDGDLCVRRASLGGAEFILSTPSQAKVDLGLVDVPASVGRGHESEG